MVFFQLFPSNPESSFATPLRPHMRPIPLRRYVCIWPILSMTKILHHSDNMGNHSLSAFAGNSSFQEFFSAGFRPSGRSLDPQDARGNTLLHHLLQPRPAGAPARPGALAPPLPSDAALARHVARRLSLAQLCHRNGANLCAPRRYLLPKALWGRCFYRFFFGGGFPH